MDNLVGQTLNRYKIVEMIGEGGMGAVFKAIDMALERDVALKIMHPNYARQQDFQQRFLQEARTAARMNHPSIVQVYDFGQDRGRLYIVMKFIPGANLEQMLNDLQDHQRWIPLGEAVGLVRQVALALEYAHRQGVLHRDLKPSNIMLEPEPIDNLPYRPVITDLGLAKLVKSGVATQDQISMGTPAYMSPEQAMGERTDARSDVYAMGVLLYELATGRLPFNPRSLGEAIKFHAQTRPPRPRYIRPDIPEALDHIILQALEKDPARRFQNAGAMAEALRAVSGEAAEVQTPPSGLHATVSLYTEYQQSLVQPRGVSVFDGPDDLPGTQAPETQPADQTQDRIQVRGLDGSSLMIKAKRSGMNIGRDPDSDIPVDDPKASRQHARIDFDGQSYRVVDLNSTNGTYLGKERLIPGVPVVWGGETTLRIGETHLRLVRPGLPLPGTIATPAEDLPVTRPPRSEREYRREMEYPPAPTQMGIIPPVSTAFTSDMRPNRLRAGQVGRITIRNLGSQTDTYSMSWDLSTDDLEFTPPYMNVNAAPGQEVVVEFRVDARRSRWTGGERRYGFNAQIRPSVGPAQVHPGEIAVPSALPGWAVPLLLVLCLVLAGLSAILASSLYGPAINNGNQASGTAMVRTQLAFAILTQTVLGQAATQAAAQTGTAESFTATSLANANQATIQAATVTGNANATLFAATQTGLVYGAQTAVALTASAQLATFQAAITQTLVSQTGTAAAAATQTAFAAGLTQQAGGNQTLAAQTAAAATALEQTASAANQLTASAATAAAGTAAAQTAQAGNALTQTAQASRHAAYIYSSDSDQAHDYQSFMQAHDYTVDLIPQDQVQSTDFSQYKLILIGHETGNQADPTDNPWGDTDEVQANKISSFNIPVLGLGRGGSLFFQALALNIGWSNSWTGSGDLIYVQDPNSTFWTTPNNIGVPGDRIFRVYNGNTGFVAVNLPAPVDGVTTIGRQADNNEHFAIVMEKNRFMLWGFEDGPANLTNKGQNTFLNALWNLAPD